MKILTKVNWSILLSSLLLISIGILVIFSSSKELALQQSLVAIFGLLIYFFISVFDYRSMGDLANLFYIFTIILLMIVAVVGFETRGSVRWIPLGVFNIQPSEFAKPVLILFLANFWSKRVANWRNILKSFLLTLPIILLVFQQPDLGSALTILSIWVGMLMASGISFKKIIVFLLIVFFLIPLTWFSLRDYQKERLVGFLNPGADPLGRGYNLIQSTIAVGSGEIFGRGLGRGTQSRLQFLPEFRTDFIFASIAEEMGFIGSMIIILIYLFLLTYLLKSAKLSADSFGYFIILGTVFMLLFQSFVNIGMNIGLLPITGITLPMISYGGSSLLATLLSLGMVASVIRFRKKFTDNDYD